MHPKQEPIATRPRRSNAANPPPTQFPIREHPEPPKSDVSAPRLFDDLGTAIRELQAEQIEIDRLEAERLARKRAIQSFD